ncbi:MAG TPA: hypothetical protein VKX17_01415 [Planctomycetota bacterium]|nr:hypothetical protein [Planctomycetota bacterium]
MTKAAALLKEAEAISKGVESWADLSNALFDPYIGILAVAYRDKRERRAFTKTAEYKKIRKLVECAKDKFGFIEGATPKELRIRVHIPKSLHARLIEDASECGMSFNRYLVGKLSGRMKRRTVGRKKSKA